MYDCKQPSYSLAVILLADCCLMLCMLYQRDKLKNAGVRCVVCHTADAVSWGYYLGTVVTQRWSTEFTWFLRKHLGRVRDTW